MFSKPGPAREDLQHRIRFAIGSRLNGAADHCGVDGLGKPPVQKGTTNRFPHHSAVCGDSEKLGGTIAAITGSAEAYGKRYSMISPTAASTTAARLSGAAS